ncbi:YY1-associated factor 2 isoform X1 [Osmerus eperlanus]|uniref:YY1-associated factor 2 isoform X1 n=1 Tax=Osmerus eperlanus TaxID=29151 RepID=UPI002E131952
MDKSIKPAHRDPRLRTNRCFSCLLPLGPLTGPCSDMLTCSYLNRLFCPLLFHRPHRKPRPVSQLVSQQVTPQFASPTQPKKEKKERTEKERHDKEPTLKKNNHKKMRPRLKNIDRSSAQHLEVTVGDLTVIITDFKEKPKPSSTSTTTTTSSTTSVSADHHNQSGSSSDNTERGVSRSSSPRGEASSVNGELH